jgi:7-carboxy-7-deazaguanine synthase
LIDYSEAAEGSVKMQKIAYISDIYSSLQEYGLYAGTPMGFIRFQGCHLHCRWCDSSYARETSGICKVETEARSGHFYEIANPLSCERLFTLIRQLPDHMLSLTGGEPLEQADFLATFLPPLRDEHKILLETNGVLVDALRVILSYVDVVSVDVKLPSSTGQRPYWEQHREFIRAALKARKEVFANIVVTPDTADLDIQEAIKLINSCDKYMPVILRSPMPTPSFPSTANIDRLMSVQRICSGWLKNVTVAEQKQEVY